jgi:hypothetical protein
MAFLLPRGRTNFDRSARWGAARRDNRCETGFFGNRPDRIEPRAVKRRPKNNPWLNEPRAQARRRLQEGASRKGKKR